MRTHREVAEELFARLSAGDVAGALATMSDDVTWLIPGRRELTPSAGSYDKRRLEKLFKAMLGELKGGLKMTVTGVVAEGDKVAREAEARGELRNGRVYSQQYHFLIEFRDGRIRAVREYLDTQHAHAVWFAK
jgi:ketosteroid isomerase-like protein